MTAALHAASPFSDIQRQGQPEAKAATIVVTNQRFMEALFRKLPAEACVWATSFPGNPKESRAWGGRPGNRRELPRLDPTHNTFFNLSSVRPANGTAGRRSENFAALHVVMFDDVGTKSALPDGIKPTYLLETSHRNFQAGFLLDPPCEDLEAAKRFFAAAAAHGLTDAGAQGPQSRYARLPEGRNHKPSCGPEGFSHRLAQWDPEKNYTLAALAAALGISLEASENVEKSQQTTADSEDQPLIDRILRSRRTRLVWESEKNDQALGFNSGSDADQYLLNRIAFQTADSDQIERVFSASLRSLRVSTDGTRKWQQRPDYRQRSITAALAFADKHPHGDTREAQEIVEQALEASVNGDTRPLFGLDAVEAFNVLKRGDLAAYAHFRNSAKKRGAPLSLLDEAISRADDGGRMLDADAADLSIQRLGGPDNLIFTKGCFWQWRAERGHWLRIENDELIKQAIHAVLPRHQVNAGAVGSVFSIIRTIVARDVEFDEDHGFTINCANGTLRLSPESPFAWELHPHRREELRTTCVPVPWNPAAECPTFIRFLDSITHGDADAEEKKRLLVQAIGYSLTTDTREEVFFILHGPTSSNGKSTLLAVIEALAGPEHTSALSLLQLGERFSKASLVGKLVNLC